MKQKRKKTQPAGVSGARVNKQKKRPAKAVLERSAATGIAVNKPTRTVSPLTDEERKARRNSYLREWRKAHKEEYAAYMKRWREQRAKGAGKTSPKRKASAKKADERTQAIDGVAATVTEAPSA